MPHISLARRRDRFKRILFVDCGIFNKTRKDMEWRLVALFVTIYVWCAQGSKLGTTLTDSSSDIEEGPVKGPLYTLDLGQEANVKDVITPENRTLCPETPDTRPPNRVDTEERVEALREVMADRKLDAYIMLRGDDHMASGSEYDQRVKYISGFSGSGFVIVTETQAAMWTDGRYFLQADDQMGCNWILMKQGESGYPTAQEWLVMVLQEGDIVGATPRLLSINTWDAYEKALTPAGIELVEVEDDLIDSVWTENRPDRPNNPLIVHTLEFAGVEWEEKISNVRSKMEGEMADVMVITALDETAWLFNLRGSDRETSPLFDSYALLWREEGISLYLHNYEKLIEPSAIQGHLKVNEHGQCATPGADCITIKEYHTMYDDLKAVSENDTDVNNIWVSPDSNFAVYASVDDDKRFLEASPIQLMKSIKNSVERQRYYKCQVRDSAATVEFAAAMEKGVLAGEYWTELSASDRLTEIRSTYDHFHGISFTPISAVGSNAAIIHYRPANETDREITTSEVYLLDSGGQYLDGTTDVTRTWYYGEYVPDQIKEAYTRVLIGSIDLADTVWPQGLYGSDLDGRTRAKLWKHGWDYRHGTGHGIGYFLNVHEGPGRINLGHSDTAAPLDEGMFFSDEPGYYEDGEFGIRLETIVGIEKAEPPNNFGDKVYLKFHPATLVPFEPTLINYDLLETSHRKWLNVYHKRCQDEVGEYLLDLGKQEAYDWLIARTDQIPDVPIWTYESATASNVNPSWLIFCIITFLQMSYFVGTL